MKKVTVLDILLQAEKVKKIRELYYKFSQPPTIVVEIPSKYQEPEIEDIDYVEIESKPNS